MYYKKSIFQVANLVCSMSNNEDGVKMVRHAADHIEALCPQVCLSWKCTRVNKKTFIYFSKMKVA